MSEVRPQVVSSQPGDKTGSMPTVQDLQMGVRMMEDYLDDEEILLHERRSGWESASAGMEY